MDDLPSANHLLADRYSAADRYRETLENKDSEPCIPSRKV